MSIKTTRIKNETEREEGFYHGVFLKEKNYEKLMHYTSSTKKEESEIINDLLEQYFNELDDILVK